MSEKKELIQAYKDLRRAFRYVNNDKTFVQKAWGYAKNGTRLGPSNNMTDAEKVCSLSALAKVSKTSPLQIYSGRAARFLGCHTGGNSIQSYNDNESKSSVREMWRKAIKTARGAVAAAVGRGD